MRRVRGFEAQTRDISGRGSYLQKQKRMGAGAGARRLYGSHVVCTLLFMDCAEPGDGERVGKGEGNT